MESKKRKFCGGAAKQERNFGTEEGDSNMTIKEIEARSGIPRANIRYYESEGLLNPEREQNGYRNYSEQDLEELWKVKLLRALKIPLEEIQKLHQGNTDLLHTLEERLEEIAKEQGKMEQSEAVCREMKEDNVSYDTLNAQHYLNKLEELAKEAALKYSMSVSQEALPEIDLSWQQSDVIPKEYALWRRFWARSFDFCVYELIFLCVLALAFHVNLVIWVNGTSEFQAFNSYITTAAGFGFALLFEPLLLMLFGTTPGKWIMGLRVTGSEGERLSWGEGLRRTKSVLWHGVGCGIPIWELIRLWKSYLRAGEGRALDWEEESLIFVKDKKKLRFAGLAVGYLCQIAVIYAVSCLAALPPNRGALTTAQFCENYNRMAEYYEMDNGCYLNENGYWIEKPEQLGTNDRDNSGNTGICSGTKELSYLSHSGDQAGEQDCKVPV